MMLLSLSLSLHHALQLLLMQMVSSPIVMSPWQPSKLHPLLSFSVARGSPEVAGIRLVDSAVVSSTLVTPPGMTDPLPTHTHRHNKSGSVAPMTLLSVIYC